jgi:alpha-1,2-mannosyltransferase
MMAEVDDGASGPGGWTYRPGPLTWLMLAIGALALAVRLASVLRGGGLEGVFGYDDGVYYTGADSLVSGRAPYRDFVLLHPPGILLVLTPFAAVGRWLSDPVGFALARAFFLALGALNAVLLTKIAGRLGIVAATTAGLFYAAWYPSMYAERTTLLEGLGTTALLVALVILFRVHGVSARGQMLAGVALGLGTTVKIWGIVLVLVVVLWQLGENGRRSSARVAAGAALAIAAVCLPFFLLAPGPMIRMVVLAQIGRANSRTSLFGRLAGMSSLNVDLAGWGGWSLALAAGCAAALLLLATAYAWWQRSSRIFVILLLATGAVLVASPSYFEHYGELVAAPLALTLAVAAQRFTAWGAHRQRSVRALTMTTVLAPLAVLVITASMTTFGTTLSWPDRDRARALAGCVVGDVPTVLIELDVLSSDLERSCPVWVDVTGLTYLQDTERGPDGLQVNRLKNSLWQKDLVRYLTSGSTTVLLHPPTEELSPENVRTLNALPLVARTHAYRIYGRGARTASRVLVGP